MSLFRLRTSLPVILCLGAVLSSGCRRLVDIGPPDSTQVPPGVQHSYDGAVGMYQGAIVVAQYSLPLFAMDVGLFTDELNMANPQAGSSVDARSGNDTLLNGTGPTEFSQLSGMRIQAQQAISALAQYPQRVSPNMTAEMYALEGMTEVLLSEMFCNGIPLGTVPLGKDFKYSGAISTTNILNLAIAHFDTALALVKDSMPISTLASVGKGRALLNLGKISDAANAVANVPTTATYGFTYDATATPNMLSMFTLGNAMVVTSREGQNGIPWTHDDPRVPLRSINDDTQWVQAKYPWLTAPFTLADGVEARLIEAEARLYAKDYVGWIGILQTLAQSVPGVPVPADPGSIAGSDSARIAVQFRERAYWLFLTGHREGDMRRLMRQYHWPRTAVVPVGPYSPYDSKYAIYGTDIQFQPGKLETDNNPLYKGCIDRNP